MPATRSSPPSGRSSVATALTNVVLPAPFGPEQRGDLAGLGDEVEAVEGANRAEALGEAVRLDDGGHGADDGRRDPIVTSAAGCHIAGRPIVISS